MINRDGNLKRKDYIEKIRNIYSGYKVNKNFIGLKLTNRELNRAKKDVLK